VANVLYDFGRQSFLEGTVSWNSNNIKVLVFDATYTPAPTTDQHLSDIPGGAILGTSANLGGKTTTAGVADANDVSISPVTGTVQGFVIYQDTGVAGTSILIAVETTVTGLPATLAGGALTITWDNGASKIFKL